MSDEEIWSLDKGAAKELSWQEREDQVVKEAEENFEQRKEDEKKTLKALEDDRRYVDTRRAGKNDAREEVKIGGNRTGLRRNFAIPHFLQTKKEKIESKTAIRQAPIAPKNQIVDSRGRIEVRTKGQIRGMGKLFRAGTGSAISAEKRETFMDILQVYASKANNKYKVDIKAVEKINRLLLGKRGTDIQDRKFMEAARKGEIPGVKIEKDTDMRKLFSPSTARKMKNAFEQIYNPEPAPAKPASTRLERNNSPRFSGGNRGPGPSSSVRP